MPDCSGPQGVRAGPVMPATLAVISSPFQFTLSRRLALLRRILAPTVAGTVIRLLAVTVMPVVFDVLGQLPQASPAAAPLSTLVTLILIVALGLKARDTLRLWTPVIGVVAGSVAMPR